MDLAFPTPSPSRVLEKPDLQKFQRSYPRYKDNHAVGTLFVFFDAREYKLDSLVNDGAGVDPVLLVIGILELSAQLGPLILVTSYSVLLRGPIWMRWQHQFGVQNRKPCFPGNGFSFFQFLGRSTGAVLRH